MEKKRKEVPAVDFDGEWKKLIFSYSREFIEFFFEKAFVDTLDLDRGVISNTEDLQKLFPDFGKKGSILPDKLLRVYEKDGTEGFVLFHVEVEKEAKNVIPKRMFQYFFRLYDKFPDAKITAIVIYIGKRVPKEYTMFSYQFGGVELTYKFNTYIVKKQQEQALEASDNPFALAVLACWFIIKANKNYDKLLDFKRKLARLCFNKNYPKEEIRDLLLFITFIIALPNEDEKVYYHEIIPVMQKKELLRSEVNPFAAEMFAKMIWGKTMNEIKEENLKWAYLEIAKAEKAKLEAEKAKLEAEAKAEKAKLEAEKVKLEAEAKAEKAKLEAEAKAEKEKLEAEKAKLEAEAKAEKEKKQLILKMYKNNFSLDLIATLVELSKEEIKQIIEINPETNHKNNLENDKA